MEDFASLRTRWDPPVAVRPPFLVVPAPGCILPNLLCIVPLAAHSRSSALHMLLSILSISDTHLCPCCSPLPPFQACWARKKPFIKASRRRGGKSIEPAAAISSPLALEVRCVLARSMVVHLCSEMERYVQLYFAVNEQSGRVSTRLSRTGLHRYVHGR